MQDGFLFQKVGYYVFIQIYMRSIFIFILMLGLNGQNYAQSYFSKIYEKTFVGPANVICLEYEISKPYQQYLQKSISRLENYLVTLDQDYERSLDLNKNANYSSLNMESHAFSIQDVESELSNLNEILLAWKSHSSKLKVVNADEHIDVNSISYLETFKATQPLLERFIINDNGKVDTIITAQFTKRTNCGGVRNCLSANPVDCLRMNRYLKSNKFYDSKGAVIPIKYFFDNFNDLAFDDKTKILTYRKKLHLY